MAVRPASLYLDQDGVVTEYAIDGVAESSHCDRLHNRGPRRHCARSVSGSSSVPISLGGWRARRGIGLVGRDDCERSNAAVMVRSCCSDAVERRSGIGQLAFESCVARGGCTRDGRRSVSEH